MSPLLLTFFLMNFKRTRHRNCLYCSWNFFPPVQILTSSKRFFYSVKASQLPIAAIMTGRLKICARMWREIFKNKIKLLRQGQRREAIQIRQIHEMFIFSWHYKHREKFKLHLFLFWEWNFFVNDEIFKDRCWRHLNVYLCYSSS